MIRNIICIINEFKSLIHNKKIYMTFLTLIVVNAVFFILYLNADKIDSATYKKMCSDVISEEFSVEELLFDNLETQEAQLIYEEYQSSVCYDEFLEKVKTEADESEQISIFQSKFSLSNIGKTRNDYAKLKDIKPIFAGTHGIDKMLKYSGIVIIAIIFVLLLSTESIIRDKKNGLLNLYKTTENGDGRLIGYKFIAAILTIFIMLFSLYMINLGITALLYGNVDLSIPVQSILSYQSYGYKACIGQFMIYDFCAKLFGLVVLLAFAFLMCIISSSEIMALVKGASVSVVFIIVTIVSKFAGNLIIYRFCSLNILDTEKFFGYLNYNIFNQAIASVVVDIILYMIFIAISIVITCIYFTHTEMYYKQPVIRIKSKRKNRKIKSVIALECNKLLFGYKIIYVILFYTFCIVLIYSTKKVHWGTNEYSYKYYMANIAGEVTEDKKEYLINEEAVFEECEKQYDDIDDKYNKGEISEQQYEKLINPVMEILKKKDGFDKCKEYTEYIEQKINDLNDSKSNIGYVYNRGFDMLIGYKSYKARIFNAISFIVIDLVLLTFLFLEDYRDNIIQVVATTYEYSRLKRIKLAIAVILNTAVYLMIYGTELIWIWNKVGLNNSEFSIYSLYNMRDFAFDVSIAGCMTWMNVLRLFLYIFLSIGYVFVMKKYVLKKR